MKGKHLLHLWIVYLFSPKQDHRSSDNELWQLFVKKKGFSFVTKCALEKDKKVQKTYTKQVLTMYYSEIFHKCVRWLPLWKNDKKTGKITSCMLASSNCKGFFFPTKRVYISVCCCESNEAFLLWEVLFLVFSLDRVDSWSLEFNGKPEASGNVLPTCEASK